MKWNQTAWRRHAATLTGFLTPLVQGLGRSERRAGAALYVEGLLLPGQRKSIEPMAQRLGADAQRLQQFITDSPWEAFEMQCCEKRTVQMKNGNNAWNEDQYTKSGQIAVIAGTAYPNGQPPEGMPAITAI